MAAGASATAASATGDPAPSLRAQIDAIGARYFAAQAKARELDTELHSLDQQLMRTRAHAATLHAAARDRAIQLYQGSTQQFTVVFDTTNAMESARRVELISQAGDRTQAVIDDYANAASTLEHQRAHVAQARTRQAALVAALDAQQAALEHALAQAQAAYEARLAADARARALAASAQTAGRAIPVRSAPRAIPPTATPVPVAPPPPSHAGTNPHHDDPFLVCTRTRESSGFYGAVNSAGYYGAYQFSQPTWDVTASHAGSPGLIGVRPDRASPWDQDQLAWTLYQWQGNTPWGGLC